MLPSVLFSAYLSAKDTSLPAPLWPSVPACTVPVLHRTRNRPPFTLARGVYRADAADDASQTLIVPLCLTEKNSADQKS